MFNRKHDILSPGTDFAELDATPRGVLKKFSLGVVLPVLFFSVTATAASPTMSERASDALVTLATTGNPGPLQAELGGTIISSKDLQKRAGGLLNLKKSEHLAPKALVTPSGETYSMVAPTITQDNFIYVDRDGKAERIDVGYTEGHRKPFVVKQIVEDGGTPWYVEFWHWITGS